MPRSGRGGYEAGGPVTRAEDFPHVPAGPAQGARRVEDLARHRGVTFDSSYTPVPVRQRPTQPAAPGVDPEPFKEA